MCELQYAQLRLCMYTYSYANYCCVWYCLLLLTYKFVSVLLYHVYCDTSWDLHSIIICMLVLSLPHASPCCIVMLYQYIMTINNGGQYYADNKNYYTADS